MGREGEEGEKEQGEGREEEEGYPVGQSYTLYCTIVNCTVTVPRVY